MSEQPVVPVETVVRGVMARSFQFDMFADLTDATFTRTLSNGVTTLTFATALDDVTVAAVRDRMTSRDDADQADRTMLRDAAAAGAINLAVMHLAYTLGDPIPAPVLPQT